MIIKKTYFIGDFRRVMLALSCFVALASLKARQEIRHEIRKDCSALRELSATEAHEDACPNRGSNSNSGELPLAVSAAACGFHALTRPAYEPCLRGQVLSFRRR